MRGNLLEADGRVAGSSVLPFDALLVGALGLSVRLLVVEEAVKHLRVRVGALHRVERGLRLAVLDDRDRSRVHEVLVRLLPVSEDHVGVRLRRARDATELRRGGQRPRRIVVLHVRHQVRVLLLLCLGRVAADAAAVGEAHRLRLI